MARTYTVRTGDNLARIAERFYGDQSMLALLVRANGGSTVIRSGDVLRIPDISQAQRQNFTISQNEWSNIQRPTSSVGSRSGYRGGGNTTRSNVTTVSPSRPGPGTAGYNYFQQYLGGGQQPDQPQSAPTPTSSPLGSAPIGGSQYYNQYVNPPASTPPAGSSRRPSQRPSASGTLRGGRQAQRTGLTKPSAYRNAISQATQVGREEAQRVLDRRRPSPDQPLRPAQAGYNVSPDLRRATAGGLQVSPGGQTSDGRQTMSYEDALALVEQVQTQLDTVGPSPVNMITGVQRDENGNPIFRDGRPVYTYREQPPDVGPSETFRGPYVGIDWSYSPWDPRYRFLGGAPELGYPDYMTPGYRSDWARIPEVPQAPAGGYGGYGGYGGGGGYTPTTNAPGGYRRQSEGPEVAPGRPRGQYGYGGGGGGGAVPFRMPGSAGAARSGVTALVSWTL